MELTLTCSVASQRREGGRLGSGLHLTVGAAARCCRDGRRSRFRSVVGNLPPEDWNRYLASPVDWTGACGRISSQLPSAPSSSQRRLSSRRRRRHCPLEVRPSGWRKLRGGAGNQQDVHNRTAKQLISFIPAPAPVLFFPAALDSEIRKRDSKHAFKGKKKSRSVVILVYFPGKLNQFCE